jgi:hypothetical protein
MTVLTQPHRVMCLTADHEPDDDLEMSPLERRRARLQAEQAARDAALRDWQRQHWQEVKAAAAHDRQQVNACPLLADHSELWLLCNYPLGVRELLGRQPVLGDLMLGPTVGSRCLGQSCSQGCVMPVRAAAGDG